MEKSFPFESIMKRLLTLLSLCAVLLTTFSCGKPQPEPEPEGPVAVTGITIEPASLSITEGQEANLFVTIAPDNADNKDFSISVSDETVITAVKVGDNRVIVTAVKAGTATVTVKSADGGKTSTCSVEIAAAEIPVESISFGFEEDEIDASQIGHTFRLAVNFSPSDATNLNSFVATSSNPDVIAVTEEGFLVVGPGTAVITLSNADGSVSTSCTFTVLAPVIQWVKMEYEKLPDMSIPRADMAIFYNGDELVVAGGHTTNFHPTNRAEYLNGGSWTEMTMKASHDNEATVILGNGKVAILGGTGSNGSDQFNDVDLYDPETHTFSAMPRMKTSRGLFHGTSIGNDIIVSGNWYNEDNIERYSAADNSFTVVKAVSSSRSQPYVLRSAENNAMVFGAWDTRGYTSSGACIVDQLDGDPFTPELFQEWKPMNLPTSFKSTDCQIGDYKYLIALENTQIYSTYGLCIVDGNDFSLIDMDVRIPHKDLNGYGIVYNSGILVDQSKQVGYLIGNNYLESPSYCVLKIDYSAAITGGKAKLTMYYTDPIDGIAVTQSGYALMPDGRLLIAGGIFNSNGRPYQTVYAVQPF